MALGRKGIYYTLRGPIRIVCILRAETEMAGLGECNRRFHGFGVANFTDQHFIGSLT